MNAIGRRHPWRLAAGPTSGRGVHGGSGRFHQQDGRLSVSLGGASELRGGVDEDGRFSVASERRTPDAGMLRERIDGRFVDRARYQYSHRVTVLDAGAGCGTPSGTSG